MKSKSEKKIIESIDNENYKRKDIAELYSECIAMVGRGFEVNFPKINKAIMNRWSISGLQFIKTEAWKLPD